MHFKLVESKSEKLSKIAKKALRDGKGRFKGAYQWPDVFSLDQRVKELEEKVRILQHASVVDLEYVEDIWNRLIKLESPKTEREELKNKIMSELTEYWRNDNYSIDDCADKILSLIK